MKASIDISMYPLQAAYKTPILEFINKLNSSKSIKVHTNTMSTQLYGDFDEVLDHLKECIRFSFEMDIKMVHVLKVFNGDLTPE